MSPGFVQVTATRKKQITKTSASVKEKKAGRLGIPESQVRLLFGFSAGCCAFPGCPVRNLVSATGTDPAVILGEIAHINSYEDKGPRADINLTLKERNGYANLVLLCPNHHRLVDKQPNTYTAADLQLWKSQLEAKVTKSIATIMPAVSFAELEVLTSGLLNTAVPVTSDFSTTPPEEKMRKNGLTSLVKGYLQMALGRANTVFNFVDSFTRLDASFAQRLKAGFSNEYERLRVEGVAGDELFEAMLDFASLGRSDLKSRAAGLALLGYFFEACEVFER